MLTFQVASVVPMLIILITVKFCIYAHIATQVYGFVPRGHVKDPLATNVVYV